VAQLFLATSKGGATPPRASGALKFFRPAGTRSGSSSDPRLVPWATFRRRFAAQIRLRPL